MRPGWFFVLLALSGCGYGVRQSNQGLGGLPGDPKSTQRIYIPVVDNLTMRIGAEPQLTSSLRETLAGAHGVQVVNREEDADYLLLGTLQSYRRELGPSPVRRGDTAGNFQRQGGLFGAYGTAQDINVSVTMGVKLLEKKSDSRRLIWSRSFAQSVRYDTAPWFTERAGASSAPNFNNSREQYAMRGIADAIARQILDQVVQDF